MSFMDRYRIAAYMSCKSCEHCHSKELLYYTGNEPDDKGKFCNLSMDTRINLILEHRVFCLDFQTDKEIERDTTYPGATYAPHDNNHPGLKPDNTDIEDYEKPERCLNQYTQPEEYIQKNDWDKLFNEMLDRNRKVHLPSNTRVLELLNNSFIPQIAYRVGLPPEKGMGFDRGLWQHRKEGKINWTLDKNLQKRREMKKILMVYLYHVWFKNLSADTKEGIMMALEIAKDFSLAKDLSWWITKIFKDQVVLVLHPEEEDVQYEFIRMSLLDKALEASMLSEFDMSAFELDLEAIAYDKLIEKYGYKITNYDEVSDKDGHEIM